MAHVTGRTARAPAGPELPERYAVVTMIGVGGMASIWAADDQVLGRRVAIKLLAEQYAEQPRFVARFEREARMAALLSGHPHVVTIYDVGEANGRPFIVMEHLAGGTLAERMAGGRPRRDDVLRWLGEAASALDFAHEKGVVHRDVKPRNLLFDDRDRLVMADFGIARAAYEESLTATNELLGTAAYISPEQALGQPATAASDRYALAVVAFETLTGGLPFGGGTLVEIAHRRTEMEAPRASERLPELPPAVDDVLLRGLAPEPQERWPTASALVAALEHALDRPAPAPALEQALDRPAPAPPPAPDSRITWTRPRRRVRIAPLLLGLAAIAVGLIAGLTVLNGDGGSGDRSATRDERAQSPQRAQRRQQQDAPSRQEQPQEPTAPQQPQRSASPAQLNDQGFSLMKAGRYDQAIPVLQRAVAGFPQGSTDLTLAYALYNLGRSLRLAGRPDEAIPILERRLQFKNQRGVVKKELAAARRQAGVGGGGGKGGRGNGKDGGDEGDGD
jgi:eukaryotic-like serine/threonine-protein kinase